VHGYGDGKVSVVVDIRDCINDKLAQQLELRREAVAVEFDFSSLLQKGKGDSGPYPGIKYAMAWNGLLLFD
jgi:hypothetical protein